jgi:hypothetical protein
LSVEADSFQAIESFSSAGHLICKRGGNGGSGASGNACQTSALKFIDPSPIRKEKINVSEQVEYLKDLARGLRYTFSHTKMKDDYREDEIQIAEHAFAEWMNEPVYLVMEHEKRMPDGNWKKKRFCVRASKRGNDVYRRRLKHRFRNVKHLFPELIDDHHSRDRTNILFITTEYNENEITLGDSWENSSRDMHDFFCRLRKRNGPFLCIPTYCALDNGYVHCHVLVVFVNKTFPIRKWISTKGKNKGKWSWRLDDDIVKGEEINGKEVKNREFGDVWGHGYVDVLAFVDPQKAIDYALGYVSKEKGKDEKKRGNLLDTRSLTFNSIYHKRSFSVSNADVKRRCITETKKLHRVQINLEFKDIEAEISKYNMLGVVVLNFPYKNGKPPPNFIEIDPRPCLKKDIFEVLRRHPRLLKDGNIQKRERSGGGVYQQLNRYNTHRNTHHNRCIP